MSEAHEDIHAPKSKKGGILKILLLFVAMMAAAGGGAYGAFAMGLFGDAGGTKEPDLPKLVIKGEADPYALPVKDKNALEEIAGEGGSEYRTAYHSFDDSFTSNLYESPALIQVSIAASTHYDGRVLRWLKQHDLALRSRILVELANTPEDDVYTPEGRDKLQKRLAAALNEELTKTEGFGGIHAVHFREFLVQ